MPSVYSTCSNDIKYGKRLKGVGDMTIAGKQVLIHGKATISPGKGLKTPLGVRTDVTQEDLDYLLEDESFQRHIKAGHIVVMGAKKDADDVAKKEMVPHDASSPKMVTAKAAEDTPGEIKKKAKTPKAPVEED